MASDTKLIRINKHDEDRIKRFGIGGDSMEKCVTKMLEIAERNKE